MAKKEKNKLLGNVRILISRTGGSMGDKKYTRKIKHKNKGEEQHEN